MTTQPKKPDLQDDYYATGKSMKGFVRSLVIASGRSTK